MRSIGLFIITLLVIGLFPVNKVEAAVFDPTFIISNFDTENFDSMTLADIERFLVANNSGLANRSFVDAYGVTRPASEIIYNAARTHYINPKWILVTLQKEQSLIQDPNPSEARLDWAMGYAVCDSCSKSDPAIQKFKGFGKQIESAAARVRYYINNPHQFNFRPGETREIDGLQVTIKNQATANLYNYTPHLHGNQNFWRLWNRWFSKNYPDGALLQAEGQSGVWLIQNGERRAITSKAALVSRFNQSDIITVSANDLNNHTRGYDIKFVNYSLVSPTNEDNIYLLVGDEKKKIASEEVFRKLGFSPFEVEKVSPEELLPFKEGREITLTSAYPYGQLIQDKETGGVYFVQEGFKHPIQSREILKVNFPNRTIIKGDKETLDGFLTAEKVRFYDGKLVKSAELPMVYVISNGTRRAIANEQTFNDLGYSWHDIITTTQEAINLHPLGPDINTVFEETVQVSSK